MVPDLHVDSVAWSAVQYSVLEDDIRAEVVAVDLLDVLV